MPSSPGRWGSGVPELPCRELASCAARVRHGDVIIALLHGLPRRLIGINRAPLFLWQCMDGSQMTGWTSDFLLVETRSARGRIYLKYLAVFFFKSLFLFALRLSRWDVFEVPVSFFFKSLVLVRVAFVLRHLKDLFPRSDFDFFYNPTKSPTYRKTVGLSCSAVVSDATVAMADEPVGAWLR